MYEPRYFPHLNSRLLNINGISYGIDRVDRFVDPQAPDKDPLHIHKQLEIFFNIDSDVSFLVNNHIYFPTPGSAVISKENDLHVCIFNKARNHSYYCLWIDGDFSSPLFSFLNKEDHDPLFTFDEIYFRHISKKLDRLYDLYKGGGSSLSETAAILEILSFMENSQQSVRNDSRLPPVFQAVLDDINENFATMNSIGDMIKYHYISQATLNRYFRKYINASPHEYLESQKLSYAARLLSEGNSVTYSCMNSGFSDCSRFIVLFKRKFNVTPMQYKKSFLQ